MVDNDNDTETISQSLREIVTDAQRIDSLSYDEVLHHAQQRGTGSLLSIASQALTTPIQTATGEGFFTDIVVEWGALNGHADASRLLVEKVFRFTAAVKSLRHWANGDEWLADDGREDLIERRIALGEVTQELIRFAESFGNTISRPGAPAAGPDPASEFEGMLIGEDDLLFLQVAVDEGAVNGVCKKSNAIHRKATGLPECPRELRERLKKHGLIDTAKGKGFTVLPKGERYVGLMRAIVPH